MLIGEISKKTGVSRDTIRFYEKKGLIQIPKRHRRQNNYKEYSEKIIDRLLLIKSIQGFGFTLKEIETYFEFWSGESLSCENLIETRQNKIIQIQEQIQKLIDLKNKLSNSLTKCQNNACNFENSVPSCLTDC